MDELSNQGPHDPACQCADCAAEVAAFLQEIADLPPLIITHYSDFPDVERITVVSFEVEPDSPQADALTGPGGGA